MLDVNYGPLFDEYSTRFSNRLEFIGSTLFDVQTFTSASTTTLNYFTTKQANKALGNLPLAGTLPDPQGFLIMSIRFYLQFRPRSMAGTATATTQTGILDDCVQLLNGSLLLKLANKDYGQFPLWMLPAGGGAVGLVSREGATADPGLQTDYAQNGIADARNAYVLQQPLFIPPVTEIGVQALWNGTITLAGGNPVTMVMFDGMMVRPVQ